VALAAVLATGAATGTPAGCAPARSSASASAVHARYVALGDSFTAGPLVPHESGHPALCLRSDHGYPALVAKKLRVRSFTNVSCAGARTADMAGSEHLGIGTNPPQLDAVHTSTTLVTVGIGGNDIGFSGIALTCLTLGVTDSRGAPCRRVYVHHGTDTLRKRIDATGPRVARLLRRIHARAPHARVVVVGYLRMLPTAVPRCFPRVPVADGDVRYLGGVERALNAMLEERAGAGGATFVSVYAPGHDMCQRHARWVEGVIPTTRSAPIHPNAAGMRATAAAVEDAVG
jgi:lysophospholipase L1-like esterase